MDTKLINCCWIGDVIVPEDFKCGDCLSCKIDLGFDMFEDELVWADGTAIEEE